MITIAINGFGRIGRTFLRTIFNHPTAHKQITIAAINLGPTRPDNLELLFRYDSLMGKFNGMVECTDDALIINGRSIKLLSAKTPAECDWKALKIDWVVDCSGRYTTRSEAEKHILAGAKKVLISAPAEHEDVTIIPGVNDDAFDRERHAIVSLGSCTTNCFAPMVKILEESFGIEEIAMTTVHAYTNDQVLLDIEHTDPRRARAAALNIIPTKTGAHKVITKLFPHLEGKVSAVALRVPTPCVSLVDMSCTLKQKASKETLNAAFKKAASMPHAVIEYTELPLVSSDFKNSEASCIIDAQLTQVHGGIAKIFGWYDNEYGYSCRLRDFLLHNV